MFTKHLLLPYTLNYITLNMQNTKLCYITLNYTTLNVQISHGLALIKLNLKTT